MIHDEYGIKILNKEMNFHCACTIVFSWLTSVQILMEHPYKCKRWFPQIVPQCGSTAQWPCGHQGYKRIFRRESLSSPRVKQSPFQGEWCTKLEWQDRNYPREEEGLNQKFQDWGRKGGRECTSEAQEITACLLWLPQISILLKGRRDRHMSEPTAAVALQLTTISCLVGVMWGSLTREVDSIEQMKMWPGG